MDRSERGPGGRTIAVDEFLRRGEPDRWEHERNQFLREAQLLNAATRGIGSQKVVERSRKKPRKKKRGWNG